jgi:flagellar motor switch protein FliG
VLKNKATENLINQIEASLEIIPEKSIALWMQQQRPQIAAPVLNLITPAKRSRILKLLAPEQQLTILQAVATLHPLDPATTEILASEINSLKMNSIGLENALSGTDTLVPKLEALSTDDQKRILNELDERCPNLAAEIRNKLLSIEKIATLLPKDLARVCADLSDKDLVLALKLEAESIRQIYLSAVSTRRRETLIETFTNIGPAPKSDIYRAQQRIRQLVSKLHSENVILFPWQEPLV